MPIRHDATALAHQGLNLDQISQRLRQPLSKVIQDLRLQAGEGEIKLSEIFFAISPEKRQQLESLIKQAGTSLPADLQKLPKSRAFEWHELDLYCRLRDPRVFRGDLYEYLADIEVAIHRDVKEALISEYGTDNEKWWREGIPLEIRQKCAVMREEDQDPLVDLFNHTTLLQLSKIINRNWALFVNRLPAGFAKDKNRLMSEFERLNSLRNSVMHPVKGLTWGHDEFEFVREWHREFVGPACGVGRKKPQ